MAVSIDVTLQDVYPPRRLVTVSGLTLTDQVEVYRVVATERTLLRGGLLESATDTSFLVVDAEFPFGVPLTYLAIVNGTDEYTQGFANTVLDNGLPVLTDAISGDAAEAIISAWDEKSWTRDSSVFKVGGRNVVVAGEPGMYEADVELVTTAGSSASNVRDLLRTATEGIIQIRNDDGEIADYWAVLSWTERRFSQKKTDERRFFVLRVAEVESWASALEAAGFSYEDAYNWYGASATYEDLEDDYATYLDLARGDFS